MITSINTQEPRTMSEEGKLKVRSEFPLWLRLQRKKAGLSARKLSEMAGFDSPNLVSLLERADYLRKNQPTSDTCHRLAAALKADPDLVLYLAKHRDTDPRVNIKVRDDVAKLQRRILEIEKIQDESELERAVKQLNVFLDTLLGK